MKNFSDKVNFIWSVADLLRGPYRPNQYGRVILPLTVLRRLDCVLEPTKDKVLKKFESLSGGKVGNVDPILNRAAGVPFHNTSKLDFARLKDDPGKIARNLASYIKSFSPNVREIFERFGFEEHITKLDEHNRLFLAALSERDETADICTDKDGNPEPDPELRDYESVPLKEDIHEYFEREVRPHVPDAWIDESKTKVGYEIPLNRHFYKYQPPRPLDVIEAEIKQLEREIVEMLADVTR